MNHENAEKFAHNLVLRILSYWIRTSDHSVNCSITTTFGLLFIVDLQVYDVVC